MQLLVRGLVLGACQLVLAATASINTSCQQWATLLQKRQLYQFNSSAPFDGLMSPEHRATIRILANGTGIVTVGLGSLTGMPGDPVHPMANASSSAAPHFIEAVYVQDETGATVAFRRPLPTDPSPATLVFAVAPGAGRLTALAFCSLHGLFQGDTLEVRPGQAAAAAAAAPCPSATLCASTRPVDCALQAAALRAQPAWAAPSVAAPTVASNGTHATATIAAVPGHVWVEDQRGLVLAMRDILPGEVGTVQINFALPGGTTSMLPYAHNSEGGVLQGPAIAVTVPAGSAASPVCSLRACPGGDRPNIPLATTVDCNAFVTEAQRLHATLFPQRGGRPGECHESLEHCPYLTVQGSSATILVGLGAITGSLTDPVHPMEHGDNPHFIESIFALDQTDRVIAFRRLSPWEEPPARLVFDVPNGTTSLTPFAYSNIHGLFRGSPVPVSITDPYAALGCVVQTCSDFTAPAAGVQVRELLRLQRLPHDGDVNEKHKPYLLVNGFNVKVVVGKGAATGLASDAALIHPMTFLGGPSKLHFITAIWVTDQDDRIVAYRELLPSTPAPASLSFRVPLGATSLTAFEACNLHGIYRGETRIVTTFAPNLRPPLPADFFGCTPRMPLLGAAAEAANRLPERVPTALVSQPSSAMQKICGNRTQWGHLLEKQLDARYFIFYTPNFTTQRASFLVCGKTLGFVGLGFPQGTHAMINSDMYTAYMDTNGTLFANDRFAKAIEEPGPDESFGGRSDMEDVVGWQTCADAACTEAATFFGFTRAFNTSDRWDVVLPSTVNMLPIVWSLQSAGVRSMTYHGPTRGWAQIPWLLECPGGHYFDLEIYACEPCVAGTYRPAGSVLSECLPCPLGTYASSKGMVSCDRCSPDRLTAMPGSTSRAACLCRPGSASDGAAQECVPCQDGLDCPLGSDLHNFRRWLSAQEASPTLGIPAPPEDAFGMFPRLTANCWSSAHDPMNVFRCSSPAECPGGNPGTCGPHLMDLACARCEPGFARVGSSCVQCVSPISAHLWPAVILSPVGVVLAYATLNFPLELADDPHRRITNAVIAIVRFLQQAGLMKKVDVSLPGTLFSTADTLQTLNFEVDWLQIACGTASFSATHWLRACLPLFGALVFAGTYLVSQGTLACKKRRGVLRFMRPLEFDKIVNAYLAVINMFFVALVGVGIKVFTCSLHPSGTLSMTEARDVVCPWGRFDGYSTSKWMTLLPASALSLVGYVVGFPALLGWACWVAPHRFRDRVFRQRWLFLFARFQPNCYWWNLLVLSQSLVLNLCPALIPFGSLQAFGMLLGSAVYTGAAGLMKPWRFWHLNVMDVMCSLMLCICYAAVSWFEDPLVSKARRGDLQTVYILLVMAAVLMAVCFGVVFLWMAVNNMRRRDTAIGDVLHLALVFQHMCNVVQDVDVDTWIRYMLQLDDHDRRNMQMVIGSLRQRLLPSSASTDKPSVLGGGTSFEAASRRFWSHSSCSRSGLSAWAKDFKTRHQLNKTLVGQLRYGYLAMTLEDCEREFGHIASADAVFRALDTRNLGYLRTAELLAVLEAAGAAEPPSQPPQPPLARQKTHAQVSSDSGGGLRANTLCSDAVQPPVVHLSEYGYGDAVQPPVVHLPECMKEFVGVSEENTAQLEDLLDGADDEDDDEDDEGLTYRFGMPSLAGMSATRCPGPDVTLNIGL